MLAIGLLNKNKEIKGVCMFGTPASRMPQIGVCGKEHADEVAELTRLWIDDEVGHNGESFLIARSLKYMKEYFPNKKIILSYADSSKGHLGIVYQATSWIYTGTSHQQIDWVIEGEDIKHNRHYWDQYGGINEAKKILGDKMVAVKRPIKYRYVFLNCDRRSKKQLLKKLKYPIQPYPKFYNTGNLEAICT